MATENTNPVVLIIEKLNVKRNAVVEAKNLAVEIQRVALGSAANWQAGQRDNGVTPDILKHASLLQFSHLIKHLDVLVDDYTSQLEKLFEAQDAAQRLVDAAPDRATAPVAEPFIGGHPTASSARARAQEQAGQHEGTRLTEIPDTTTVVVPPAPGIAPSGSAAPSAAAVPAMKTPSTLPAINPNVLEPRPAEPAAPRNVIEVLMGLSSPLLDIFSLAPWLHSGRGRITIGSEGFNWHQHVDPLQKLEEGRLQALPSSFYGGAEVPAYVLLRLKTTIVLWDFSNDPEKMLVYAAGLSDADPSKIRWVKLANLPASYTRRVEVELNEYLATIR